MKVNSVVRVWLFLMLLMWSVFASANSHMKVVFINPGYATDNDSGDFWPNVNHFMVAAANDLNIDLVSLHAERNHILMKKLVSDAIALKPDYLILVNEKQMLPQMLEQLVGTEIKVFLLLNKFSRSQQASLPKAITSKVIGCLSPNNKEVGEQLAQALIKRASKFKKQQLTMYALLGDYNTPAAEERRFGLQRALKKHPHVSLIDSTVANWSESKAYKKTYGVLSKHPADIIWSANDAMAFGAIAAVNKLKQSDKVIIGGINWDVHDKGYATDVSFGGHVTLGAKALLMLHDNHLYPKKAGAMSQQLAIFESSDSPARAPFGKLLREQEFEQIDFSRFSVSSQQPLEFNLQNLVNTRH
ncbi:MAG: ABC transporter substrate-binding protein [Pseudoalteromonas spongiae]